MGNKLYDKWKDYKKLFSSCIVIKDILSERASMTSIIFYFNRFSGSSQSKRLLLKESIKSSAISGNSLAPAMIFYNTKIQAKFNRNCINQGKIFFAYITYKINLWSNDLGTDFE